MLSFFHAELHSLANVILEMCCKAMQSASILRENVCTKITPRLSVRVLRATQVLQVDGVLPTNVDKSVSDKV